MELLFNIDKKGSAVFAKEALDLCPELAFLSEKERLYVILVYDYYSMFRQFPEQDRINKTNNHIISLFGSGVDASTEKIKIAIEAYRSLQYDPRRELVAVYKTKIQSLSAEMDKTLSSTGVKNILESIDRLKKAIEETTQEIELALETRNALKGGGDLSFLEKIKENKEVYLQVTKKKNAV